MILPDLHSFLEKSRQGNLVPVWREILADMETPVSVFKKICDSENAFLLESVEQGEKLGRYSFLGFDPHIVFKCKGQEIQIFYPSSSEDLQAKGDPLDVLQDILSRYHPVDDPNLPVPFTGGAVGYLSYDVIRHWEKLPDSNPDDLCLPDAYFCICESMIVFDHVRHRMILLANAHVQNDDPEKAYFDAVHKMDVMHERLKKVLPTKEKIVRKRHAGRDEDAEGEPAVYSNFERGDFERVVEKAREYIFAGDIFQVVLSQRFQKNYAGDPFDIYRALRAINPSPYMYYLQFGDLRVAGSSPEIMIRLHDREVCVRPIAGTRPRGKTVEEDSELEASLLADPKEKAEHIMLLDLGRNDVGRVSDYGTVRVEDRMVVERYSHVMHLVSNVTGRLKEGMSAFDVLRAGFPAGTVSGAPKIRAMEIIDELETVRRGPYAGAVGYFSFNGNLDTAITIRTIIVKGNTIYVQAGAGLVADSVPAREYEETVNKAKGMLHAVKMAENGLD